MEYPEKYQFDSFDEKNRQWSFDEADYNAAVEEWGRKLTDGQVRGIAGRIAGALISDARNNPGPVVWVTGNSYMPPFRSFDEAERVWNAEANADGELFAFLVELVEDHLNRASVILESPDWDNALYVVDLKRWQYIDDTTIQGEKRHNPDYDEWDINSEWEPVDPLAVDDHAENPRE